MRNSLVALAILAIGIMACGGKSSPTASAPLPCDNSGATATVNATDGFTFSAQTISVAVGQSVCWQNIGTQAHTVTDIVTGGRRFDGQLPSGQSFIQTFGFSGSFEYRCSRHSTMTGTVVVQ